MKNINQEILLGVVKLYKQRPRDGVIRVTFKDEEDHPEEVDVVYTSPYYQKGFGGMIGVPHAGSKVLVLYKGNRYYYLSTVVENPDNDITKGSRAIFNEPVYNDSTGEARVTTYANEQGSGLKISNKYQSNKIVDNVVLKSYAGKKLILDDSPENDCIQLSTNDHSIFKMAAGSSKNSSRGEVTLETRGSVSINSHSGNVELKVQDTGKQIDITNNAFPAPGLNKNVITPALTELFVGNVNIESKWADINIKGGVFGGIFIKTALGEVIINKLGQVTVKGTLGVDVVAEGPINLKSTTAINLDAPVINANAGATMNLFSNGTLSMNNAALAASVNGIIPIGGSNGGGPCVIFGPGIPAVPIPAPVLPLNPLNISDLDVTPR